MPQCLRTLQYQYSTDMTDVGLPCPKSPGRLPRSRVPADIVKKFGCVTTTRRTALYGCVSQLAGASKAEGSDEANEPGSDCVGLDVSRWGGTGHPGPVSVYITHHPCGRIVVVCPERFERGHRDH